MFLFPVMTDMQSDLSTSLLKVKKFFLQVPVNMSTSRRRQDWPALIFFFFIETFEKTGSFGYREFPTATVFFLLSHKNSVNVAEDVPAASHHGGGGGNLEEVLEEVERLRLLQQQQQQLRHLGGGGGRPIQLSRRSDGGGQEEEEQEEQDKRPVNMTKMV